MFPIIQSHDTCFWFCLYAFSKNVCVCVWGGCLCLCASVRRRIFAFVKIISLRSQSKSCARWSYCKTKTKQKTNKQTSKQHVMVGNVSNIVSFHQLSDIKIQVLWNRPNQPLEYRYPILAWNKLCIHGLVVSQLCQNETANHSQFVSLANLYPTSSSLEVFCNRWYPNYIT